MIRRRSHHGKGHYLKACIFNPVASLKVGVNVCWHLWRWAVLGCASKVEVILPTIWKGRVAQLADLSPIIWLVQGCVADSEY